MFEKILNFLTGEVLFFRGKVANGLSVIIFRTAWILFWFLVIASIIREAFYPSPDLQGFFTCIKGMLVRHKFWFAGLAGGIFVSLYSRFSSQWLYLANTYNQIKRTESSRKVSEINTNGLNQWKAGFIEDAEELHLATKPIFAGTIMTWGKIKSVENNYIDKRAGRKARFHTLMSRVNKRIKDLDDDYIDHA